MPESEDFQPDWVSPPGDTIAEILKERNLSLSTLASKLKRKPDFIQSLICGDTEIDGELASQLQEVLGASTEYWLARESKYRRNLARLTPIWQKQNEEWVKALPMKDMVKFGWIKSSSRMEEKVSSCLKFFGVPHSAAWRSSYAAILESASFRTSQAFDSQPAAVAAWLRQGELQTQPIQCKPWDRDLFEETLQRIRAMTRQKDPRIFLPALIEACANCGVAVSIVRAPAGCRASGATRFISKDRALMLLSFRYLSDDQFWFTFFHEAGHLILHNHERIFLEGVDQDSDDQTPREEKQANDFAARMLIPDDYQPMLAELRINSREIIMFARAVGVSPGIVVGQLQHLGRIDPSRLNSLKRRFKWATLPSEEN